MSIFIRISLFSFFLVNISVANNEDLSKSLDQYSYKPFKFVNNKQTSNAPYITAKVNGKKAYVLLDSGSSGVSIFNNSLTELNLKGSDSSTYSANMSGEISKDKTVVLKNIKIGDILLKNIKSGITNQPKKMSLPTIVLGTKLLDKYNALFDFSASKVFFQNRSFLQKIII